MDGITLSKVVHELQGILIGARIEKIFEPSKEELEFIFNSKEKGKQILYTSISAQALRLFLIKDKTNRENVPPPFCMLMRKHLFGARVEEINQFGTDRIAYIDLIAKNELGLVKQKRIVFEMLGRHGNVILLEKGQEGEYKIIDALRRVPIDISKERTIFPGFNYKEIDNRGKVSLFSDEAYLNYENIQGFQFKRIKEIEKRIKDGEKIKDIIDEIKNWIKNCEGFSEELEEYYHKDKKDTLLDKTKLDLIKKLKKENKKIKEKIKGYEEKIELSETADEYRHFADLIYANLNQISKGMKEITVKDFLTNENITIELDGRKFPKENATAYYKKYHKLKESKNHLIEQREKLLVKVDQYPIYESYIENATSFEEITNLLYEIYEQRILIDRAKRKFNKQKNRYGTGKIREKDIRSIVLPSNKKVLIGANNLENDAITFKISNKTDLWFHIKDMPGSHTVLRLKGEEPLEKDILETAKIAKQFSKGKDAQNVGIDYCFVKDVKKIKGSYLGNVTFKNNKTVYV